MGNESSVEDDERADDERTTNSDANNAKGVSYTQVGEDNNQDIQSRTNKTNEEIISGVRSNYVKKSTTTSLGTQDGGKTKRLHVSIDLMPTDFSIARKVLTEGTNQSLDQDRDKDVDKLASDTNRKKTESKETRNTSAGDDQIQHDGSNSPGIHGSTSELLPHEVTPAPDQSSADHSQYQNDENYLLQGSIFKPVLKSLSQVSNLVTLHANDRYVKSFI